MRNKTPLLAPALAVAASCTSVPEGPRIAHLAAEDGDPRGFAAIRSAFRSQNPGYDISFHRKARELAAANVTRIVFVQDGETTATVSDASAEASCELTVGDIVVLRSGCAFRSDGPLDLLAFETPEAPSNDVPTFVRPDWDPSITDTPGGCAEETGAYRRILLTWLEKNGPYTYHALNAHRVRITDSFSHYHPLDGGFDEFYLVQMVQPNARILTSERVDDIESRAVTKEDVGTLLTERSLTVGDLVYLPRGTMHRGLGGVLAQVITTPGFKPGAEIGVDHHLRAINERLGLSGEDALPFHAAASEAAVRK